LAQYAPSNSNIQPWHMVFASGASRDRLVAALIDEAQRRPPNIPPLPASFQQFRNELGAQVYGAMGISREDTARHAAAVLRNWEFSARQWPVLFACTGTLAQRIPSV
jgi:nitroreductase